MQVALGGSAFSIEGMSAAAVLAEHDRVSEVFKTKFKVGGVAAVSAEAPSDHQDAGRSASPCACKRGSFSK